MPREKPSAPLRDGARAGRSISSGSCALNRSKPGRSSRTERLWRWCRRRDSLAVAVGLAAVAIATTIGLSISLAVYQYRAASRLGVLLQEVQSRQRQVDQQASHLALQHGQALCEQGDVAQGLLWLVRGLKSASIADDRGLEAGLPPRSLGMVAPAAPVARALRASRPDPGRRLRPGRPDHRDRRR